MVDELRQWVELKPFLFKKKQKQLKYNITLLYILGFVFEL